MITRTDSFTRYIHERVDEYLYTRASRFENCRLPWERETGRDRGSSTLEGLSFRYVVAFTSLSLSILSPLSFLSVLVYRSSRFHAKSRPPLIQRRPTGHSSRTAHYRYYKLRVSSFLPPLLSPFSLSSRRLISNNYYCCLLCGSSAALFPRQCFNPFLSLRIHRAFSRWVVEVTGNLFLNLLPMTDI